MILADKIINERKKNGWSQEELAAQLSVSRQSVSKWESAQAVPDLQKIIAMADIFGVSTDYLLKDEIEPERPVATTDIVVQDSISEPPCRKVSMEEANEFLNNSRKTIPVIANGVSLCILSPVVLIFLAGLSNANMISENMAAGIGLIVLFACIAVAIYLFIMTGARMSKYKYLDYELIDTEYGVTGMVKEKKEEYKEQHTRMLAIGVLLCVLCSVPLIVVVLAEMAEMIIISMVCLLLIMVSVGVNIMTRSGSRMECYEKLLEENEYSAQNKASKVVRERIASCYWSVIVAIFVGSGIITGRWDINWVIWPIAGILFAAIKNIINAIYKVND